MTPLRDDFLRRYATTPIHVPRLERLLDAYDGDNRDESFLRQFMAWDRACADVDAARIVAEILSIALDESGRIRRISDAAVQGAIRWMAEARSVPVTVRASILQERLSSSDRSAVEDFISWLETAGTLDEARFEAVAASLATETSRRDLAWPSDAEKPPEP